jgi:hypothetical protein
MQIAFIKAGGQPSKFVEAGNPSQYGTWAGIRYFKTAANGNIDDASNPVWQAVLDVNNNLQPEMWAVSDAYFLLFASAIRREGDRTISTSCSTSLVILFRRSWIGFSIRVHDSNAHTAAAATASAMLMYQILLHGNAQLIICWIGNP